MDESKTALIISMLQSVLRTLCENPIFMAYKIQTDNHLKTSYLTICLQHV
jgi:hypothetical protein